MGRHHTYVDGESITHNDFLDYRTYITYAAMVAASVGWGFNETGRISLCLATGAYYYWNGATNVIWPSTGGAGAPSDRTYITTTDESAILTGSVRHQNLTNAGGFLHESLLHHLTHLHDGTDPLDVHNLLGKLADEQNAGWIKTKAVDAPVVGDDLKFLQYNHGASKFQLATVAGGGDMMKAVYDTDVDNVVESADNADTLDGSHGAAFAAVTHKDTHKTGGGANAFLVTDLLDGIARVTSRANSGANVGSRRRTNYLNGTNTTWTVSDVPASEEVTVRLDASALTGLLPYEATATALATYTPVTAGASGQAVVVHSSHATDGGEAVFIYSNAAWGYNMIINYGASYVTFCEEW